MRFDRKLAAAATALVERLRPAPTTVDEDDIRLMPGETRVALVTLFGVPRADVPDILTATAATLARFDRVVYLTDDPDFSELRRRGATFEYLPALSEITTRGAGLPWARYLAERRTILVAKWRPVQEISYGLSFDDLIAAVAAAAAETPGAAEF
ncbi:hypothetical protein [Methylobrevis albus]|uniref:Uncharacterized protein n=1 Tax=Methylobrevis albus TaxID=2793297 RepID=A0A931I5W1_9HYPH|nr:hypothetical protein [Methylobrevis albus]MBH0239406.1 hypothetical protein [Methylobrevis albus]